MAEFAKGTGNLAIAPKMLGSAANAFALQPGSRLRENKFGLDEITRVWIGPKAIARAFALSQTTDPEFAGLYKVDHEIELLQGRARRGERRLQRSRRWSAHVQRLHRREPVSGEHVVPRLPE